MKNKNIKAVVSALAVFVFMASGCINSEQTKERENELARLNQLVQQKDAAIRILIGQAQLKKEIGRIKKELIRTKEELYNTKQKLYDNKRQLGRTQEELDATKQALRNTADELDSEKQIYGAVTGKSED